jgi:hypothetical protein
MPVVSFPAVIAVVWGGKDVQAGPADRESSKVDRDEVGGNHQAGTGGPREGEIFDELIRARLIDCLTFLDLPWPFLCLVIVR